MKTLTITYVAISALCASVALGVTTAQNAKTAEENGGALSLRPEPVVVPVDECVKNLEEARIVADRARKEWRLLREKRQKAELAQLKRMNIPDLSKKAVGILVRHENPSYIVNKAKVATREEMDVWIMEPPWHNGTARKDKIFWSIVYEEPMDENHDWWIEQHKWFGQYRLIDNSTQHIYFSIHDKSKLRTVLAYIVMFGDTKPFYHVVDGDTCVPENYCDMLPLSEAVKIFPETINLAEGVYAEHPCNPYALVPIKDFHANIAMDKTIECVVLLGRMGAKSVKVSRMSGEKNVKEGEGSVSYMGCNATVNAALSDRMKSNMDLEVVFSGNSHVDISESLLEKSTWHKSDKTLKGILMARLSGNKLEKLSVIEEEQSDYNFDFKAAASVLKIAEADLRAKLEKMRQTQRTFIVAF